jgi:hypothetical protein
MARPFVLPFPGGGGGGGGGGGSNQPGCNTSDQFPDSTVGGKPFSHTYTFSNVSNSPITLHDAVLTSSQPNRWHLDATQLQGVLKPGEVRTFTVTFTPPTK